MAKHGKLAKLSVMCKNLVLLKKVYKWTKDDFSMKRFCRRDRGKKVKLTIFKYNEGPFTIHFLENGATVDNASNCQLSKRNSLVKSVWVKGTYFISTAIMTLLKSKSPHDQSFITWEKLIKTWFNSLKYITNLHSFLLFGFYKHSNQSAKAEHSADYDSAEE